MYYNNNNIMLFIHPHIFSSCEPALRFALLCFALLYFTLTVHTHIYTDTYTYIQRPFLLIPLTPPQPLFRQAYSLPKKNKDKNKNKNKNDYKKLMFRKIHTHEHG